VSFSDPTEPQAASKTSKPTNIEMDKSFGLMVIPPRTVLQPILSYPFWVRMASCACLALVPLAHIVIGKMAYELASWSGEWYHVLRILLVQEERAMTETQTIRAILADDHAVVRKGIREFLEEEGDIVVVAEAADGDTAATLAEKHRPDVLILDIQMPGPSGIEVTRALRAAGSSVAILILTAYDDDPYIMAGIQAGANGYVLKSAAPEEIVRAVRAVHEGQSAVDPAVAAKLMAHLAGQHQAPSSGSVIESLTERELEVLTLVAKGLTNRAIGHQLNISDRTVQGHLANIFAKMGVSSRTEAVMAAVRQGWLEV
jgi:DNA-binding NarL/FixJ family response regulator